MAVDQEFAARLRQACDDVPTIIPSYGQGRLVVLAKRLRKSQEAVRRWCAGEARPRVRVMRDLAELLNVDEAWLSLGVKTEMRPAQKIQRLRAVDGAVHLALGLALSEAFHCSTPDANDPRKPFVDFYVNKDGEMAAIRTALAREFKPGNYEFVVPRQFEQVQNVGIIASPEQGFAFTKVIDLQHHLIAKHKESSGGDYTVTVRQRDDKLMSGRDQWRTVQRFGELV